MRLELTESYPGEAREKAGEIFKALAVRLGAKARTVDKVEDHTSPLELSPYLSQRQAATEIEGVVKSRVSRMLADVDRFIASRGGAS